MTADNILLAGCTLWSNPASWKESFDPILRNVSDFSQIRNFSVSQMQQLHLKDLAFLEDTLDYADKIQASSTGIRVVFATHFAPFMSCNPNE